MMKVGGHKPNFPSVGVVEGGRLEKTKVTHSKIKIIKSSSHFLSTLCFGNCHKWSATICRESSCKPGLKTLRH